MISIYHVDRLQVLVDKAIENCKVRDPFKGMMTLVGIRYRLNDKDIYKIGLEESEYTALQYGLNLS